MMFAVLKRARPTLTFVLVAFLLAPAFAGAQTVTDPTTVQFTPSPDHNLVGSNGLPIVDHYNFLVYTATGTQALNTLNIGKPAPDADGYIRYDFSNAISSWSLPGGSYVARVDAVGPGGDGLSGPSNTFTFSFTVACSYNLSSVSASFPAAGDSGSVGVTTQSGCSWTTTSNASWIAVVNGTGTGSGTATYSVATNTGTTSRTGTLTIAGVSYTVTQAGTSTTTATLPSPWQHQDIGSVGLAGSASYSSGVFTVKGAGADIWGTADGFHYVYQPLAGDGQIVARVTSLTNTHSYAKAGVMFRETLTAGSRDVILDLTPGGGIEFMARPATGGSTTYLAGSSQAPPAWLKLTRSGSTIAASVSADGVNWRVVGTTTVSMASSTYVGLAVTSHTTSALNTATFDNVAVSAGAPLPSTTLPSPWRNQDIGSVGLAGSASYASGVFTVKGAGADIWGTADAFQFAYQPLAGDGQIVARVTSLTNTQANAKAGVMLRETLSASSASVILDLQPGGGIEFMARPSTGASTTYIAGASRTPPAWLKLVRSGTTVTGSVSGDGLTWTVVGTTTVSMASSIYVGLAVTSHTTTALNTATFDNVTVSLSAPQGSFSLPSPWASQDVGSVGLAGSATYASGVFTVKGAGADIWGTADSFRYVYQPLAGDGQIVARVTSLTNTQSNAKAGVMVRETLAAGSSHVILDMKPGGGIEFMCRPSTGASTTYLAGGTQSAPAWLKLVRSGSTITGYVSADGSTWRAVGTTTVSMTANVYVGLAVTSHTTSVLATATFDNVAR